MKKILILVSLFPCVSIRHSMISLDMMAFYLRMRMKVALWVHKSFKILNENFCWPHMRKDVHNICERCLTCKLAKSKRTLRSRLGVKLLFSTTYHLETDEQTEIIPHVEFSYNRVFVSITSYSPFKLAFGFNLLSPLDLLPLPILPNCVNDEGLSKA
ncbi:hypothetical protein CR513_22442, partial [Mucuna pruriens]